MSGAMQAYRGCVRRAPEDGSELFGVKPIPLGRQEELPILVTQLAKGEPDELSVPEGVGHRSHRFILASYGRQTREEPPPPSASPHPLGDYAAGDPVEPRRGEIPFWNVAGAPPGDRERLGHGVLGFCGAQPTLSVRGDPAIVRLVETPKRGFSVAGAHGFPFEPSR